MNPMKMKLIKEIMSHLSDKQGMSLKESLDESRKPKIPEELELSKDGELEKEKPDILVESKEIESMEPEDEMSDEELEELISKLVKK